jgi:hypothetical protein
VVRGNARVWFVLVLVVVVLVLVLDFSGEFEDENEDEGAGHSRLPLRELSLMLGISGLRAVTARMKTRTKFFLGGGLTLLAGMLLINPSLTNPPAEPGRDLLATNAPPAEIVTLLRGACYDCHSHETIWPWYSHVAPVSWWLAGHVNNGRKRLNFSQWPHDDPRRAAKWLGRIGEAVEAKEMPLPGYDKMHPAARLSAEQRDQIVKWARQEADRLRAHNEGKEPP